MSLQDCCPGCGAPLAKLATQCSACGLLARPIRFCQACGQPNAPRWYFCARCGAQLRRKPANAKAPPEPATFVALDVETANEERGSICQVGLAYFTNGVLTNRWLSLVDPEAKFSKENIAIHGITAKAVKRAPAYPKIAGQLREALENRIVVHHTPFDLGALMDASERYHLALAPCIWLDSSRVARDTWADCRDRGYGLGELAHRFSIEFHHHAADEDAKAAGLILLRAIEAANKPLSYWVRLHGKDWRGVQPRP